MRDYKNVKVPRSYRSSSNRVTVKRVDLGRGAGRLRTDAKGIKKATLQFLLAIVIVGGGWLGWQAYQVFLHAETFQIAGIDVKGMKQMSEAELREIAGVFTGQNIFRVDLEAAASRARANPWVQDVRIYRRLPNRISMVVTERVPYALLDTGSGRYLMDGDGVVIDRIGKETALAWRLPVIVIKDYRIRSGEQVTSEGMAEALTLLGEISMRGGWRTHEVTINAFSPESLSVLYADHEFKIGAGNYAEKLRRLAEIMADGKQRNLELAYVDLRPERQAAAMVKHIEKVRGREGKKVRR
jgi:cell division protein FtsQ